MSKYDPLWKFVAENCNEQMQLSFDEINEILGFSIDHSFLNFKKELDSLGYQVSKISLKQKTIIFHKM